MCWIFICINYTYFTYLQTQQNSTIGKYLIDLFIEFLLLINIWFLQKIDMCQFGPKKSIKYAQMHDLGIFSTEKLMIISRMTFSRVQTSAQYWKMESLDWTVM